MAGRVVTKEAKEEEQEIPLHISFDVNQQTLSLFKGDAHMDAIDVRYKLKKSAARMIEAEMARLQESIRAQHGPVLFSSPSITAPDFDYDTVLKALNILCAKGTLERCIGKRNIPEFCLAQTY